MDTGSIVVKQGHLYQIQSKIIFFITEKYINCLLIIGVVVVESTKQNTNDTNVRLSKSRANPGSQDVFAINTERTSSMVAVDL